MIQTNYYAGRASRYIWIYISVLITAFSCNNHQSDPGRYTNEFTPVVAKVDKLFDDEPAKAIVYLDSAFKFIPAPSIHDRCRYYILHFNYCQKIKKDHQAALLYADSMMATASLGVEKSRYASLFAEANFAKGDAYFDMGRYSDAYQSYYQGYLTSKNYFNSMAMSDYTYRMGMIMYKQKNYKLAANYFKDSFNQSNPAKGDFPIFYRKQELLDNIGLCYGRNYEIDSALVYFDKALSFIDSCEGNFGQKDKLFAMARGVIYGNKAEVYIHQKSYDQAGALLKKSISINLKKGNDNVDAQLAEIKLAHIYLAKAEFDSLYVLLGNLRNQLDSVKNPEAEADWHLLTGKYFIQQNDLKKAISHLQRYNTTKDSLTELSRLILKSDVDQQLNNYEKQHEIDQLSSNNKSTTMYLYGITLMAVLTFIIMFLVYRNWKRSKKDVLTMNVLNQQINEQNHVLEKALTELEISSQEKDRILRTVAHDLRNPIGGIASLTTLMANDDYTDEQKELINLLKETSLNSLELINEILEATNLSLVAISMAPVDINLLVSNSVELLRFKAAEKRQLVSLETMPEPIEITINREKIWRVISNLISNAIKFSPVGAPIAVKVANEGHQIVISVKDNGIGIPDKMKDQIFNMFTSAQRPGTSGEKSFGLGLSICRQIVEKHHGRIWFESNENGGAAFFVSLPLR